MIVIGSGFGGAVCALRAAEAGLRVVVLERGQRMTPALYEGMAQGRTPVFHGEEMPGVLELHRLNGLIALTASAVGGGSNIYTAVTIRPPREVFDDYWPAGLDYDVLAPFYDRVEKMIAPTPIPSDLPRTAALEVIARRLGGDAIRLPLSMDWPEDVAELRWQPEANGVYRELTTWLRGGRVARKRTLGQTYLAQAELAGARIRPLHEVLAVTPRTGRHRVDYRASQHGEWRAGSISAPRVVVAMGTLNTTRFLLRCRNAIGTLPGLSEAIGQRFFTNGDFGGLLVGPKLDIAPDAGPPVTGWVDLWERERMYLMETGLVPFDFGGFTGLLNPARWFGGLRLTAEKRCTWSFGTMGYGDSPGRIVLGRRGRIAHRHSQAQGAAFLDRSMAVLKDLAGAAGAKLVAPPAMIARRLPITVHPLGGAVMADSPEAGVANSLGEVYGYPGLYIADGSLIPAPTGVPPSMTIAALAERIADHLVNRC
ncbi:MAG: GMC family oxidoreductase [Phycisphaerae bacterium]|nr:GMC family oxidoreductase [Phycisphaerae bacterium]